MAENFYQTPRAIAVFARAPQPGQVKTRLARSIGDETAATLYAAMLRDTLDLAQTAANSARAEVIVAYTPDNAFDPGEYSLANFWKDKRLPQREGDLGERMLGCLQSLQSQGAGDAMLIGSDTPDLPPSYIVDSFARLADSDIIFGPAGDGGFYLIATRCPLPPEIFAGVEWSAADTLDRTRHNAARLGLATGLWHPWHDVDDEDDLRALQQRMAESPDAARHTRAWLDLHELV